MEQKTAIEKRKTIGILINQIDGWYSSPIWRGLHFMAEERNVDLLVFSGMSLKSRVKDEWQHNVLYKMVNSKKLDGIFISAGTLASYIPKDEFVQFVEPFRTIPMVGVSWQIPGVPTAVFDNKASMRLVIEHLIEHHNYKRIAFVCGPKDNPEAILRYEAYEEVLKEHNIPIDPELVIPGGFREQSGIDAVDILLNKSIIRPEAIVTANDETAIGAYVRLKDRGIDVAKEIALTGFDDIEAAKLLAHPLTTIHQPVYEMSLKAMEMLCDLLDGKEVPDCVSLRGELVVRQSCGCTIGNIKKAEQEPNKILSDSCYDVEISRFEQVINQKRVQIIEETTKHQGALESKIPEYREMFQRLFDAFIIDLRERKKSEHFVDALTTALTESIIKNNSNFLWYDSLLQMRSSVLHHINSFEMYSLADELFYRGLLLIGEIKQRQVYLLKHNSALVLAELRLFIRSINSVSEVWELCEILRKHLPVFGIKQGYFCLYDKPVKNIFGQEFEVPKTTRLMMGYNEEGLVKYREYETKEMLPDDLMSQENRNELLFLQLFNGNDHFGYIALSFISFDLNPDDDSIYESIRENISIVLKTQMLFKERKEVEDQLHRAILELKEYNKEIERNQSIMMEQAKLASLGQLIGGIAHNLKSPILSLSGGLITLNKLSEEYKNAIGDAEVTEEDHREIAQEMQTWIGKMKPNLSYMSEIISAVKGHATTYNSSNLEYFTIGKVVNHINILVKIKISESSCTLETICPEDIMSYEIKGYESVLVQVLDNLIVNSIQAYNNVNGKIILDIKKKDENVIFCVKDFAGGISNEVQSKLFSEMVTTKGSAGTGIGLYYSYSTIKGKFGGDIWFESEDGVGTAFYVSVALRK
jgi:DNA-binding LacI/PurR family transcriptional regulator/signal transduction histidine kinase